MAVIYYLNWDREREEHGPATELFHKLNVESVLEEDEQPGDSFDRDEFEELYREVAEIEADPDQLEQVWKEWQRTGYTEGPEFTQLRYCERCDSYIEGVDEAVTHATQNHGYDGLTDPSEPEYIHSIRSMSVGDVIEVDGTFCQAKAIGFEEIDIQGGVE